MQQRCNCKPMNKALIPTGITSSQDGTLEGSAASDAQLARPEASGSGPVPSSAAAEQPAGRPISAPAAAVAAKQVKRLHSPTEEASQKLQRRGSEGPCAVAVSGIAVSPTVPTAVGGSQSVGLPAPTVNGVPANLAGTPLTATLAAVQTIEQSVHVGHQLR